jgi:maleate cis-trans isomerase
VASLKGPIRPVIGGIPISCEFYIAFSPAKALLEQHGFAVVSHGRLDGVHNIYDETPERAYRLGRAIDTDNVEAVFLSGSGMPTIAILETLERDLGKPAISAASAMMWRTLALARVREPIAGYGRLLAGIP